MEANRIRGSDSPESEGRSPSKRRQGALIGAMLFERVCPACGQPTNESSCLLCGNETQLRSAITDSELANSSGIVSPADPNQDFEASTEVIYLSPDDAKLKFLAKVALKVFKYLYLYGIPLMCVWLAIANPLRVLFIVGAVLGSQMIFINLRAKRFTGPVVDDEDFRSRVSPPLLELCALAGVPTPRVRIQQSVNPIGMALYKQEPLLYVSPDFLQAVDDRALRAFIAHEVVHQKKDMADGKKRSTAIVIALELPLLAALYANFHGKPIYLALCAAFFFPCLNLISWATGYSWQARETRADLEGVAAANDPEAAISGLEWATGLTAQRRRMIFGPPAFRFLLLPYSLRPTTHPSNEDRIAAIQAMPLDESTAEFEVRTNHARTRALSILTVAIVVGLILFIQHTTAHSPSQTISPHVESPGGAHFIPVDVLGIPPQEGDLPTRWQFFPLTHDQIHQVSTTAKQALAIADSSLDIHAADDISATVAEGSWAGVSFLNFGNGPTLTAANGIAAYVVVFKGADIADPYSPGLYNLCVVVVKAVNGTIEGTYYYAAND
jgi:Zn-dependent protease with chaperone function